MGYILQDWIGRVGNMMFCTDCMIAAVNGDFTGMDDETEKRVIHGLDRIGYVYPVFDAETGDGVQGFSWSPCTCCTSKLGGARFTFDKAAT